MDTLTQEDLLAEFQKVGWTVQEHILRTTPVLELHERNTHGRFTPIMYNGRSGSYKVLVKMATAVTACRMPITMNEAIQHAKNAEACWQVAKGLGLQHMVPITVARHVDLPNGDQAWASVQYLWPQFTPMKHVDIMGVKVGKLENAHQPDLRSAALFDIVTNQRDRHFENYTIDVAAPHHLRLFDHELSFLTTNFVGPNEIVAYLPDDVVPRSHLMRIATWLAADHTAIKDLLTARAYEDHIATCQHILLTRRLGRPPGVWGRP